MIQLEHLHPLELNGDRVVLRPFEEKDLKELQELWKDGNVMRYVGFRKGLPKSDAEMQQWFAALYDSKSIGENDYFLAVTDLAGRFLGEAKIGKVESDQTSEPDVKLLPIYWGKGYAKEVFSLIISFTFEHLPVEAIKVTPNILNERAIRLYHSLGFKVDGSVETWYPPQKWESIAQPIDFQTMLLSRDDYTRQEKK